MIYSESLSRNSQQLTTDLQMLRNNVNEVLYFVPTIDLLASEIQQVKDAVLQLQHHDNSQFFPFLLSGIRVLTNRYIKSYSPIGHPKMVIPTGAPQEA